MSTKLLIQRSSQPARLGWAMAACAGALLAYTLRPHDTTPTTASQTPTTLSAPDQAFTRTFMGTEPDGVLASATGHDLTLSPELIRRFEYHLTAVGERTQAQIRAAIEADLSRELNEQGRQHAMRILDAYLKFKTALGNLNQPRMHEVSGTALAQHFKAIRDLRALYFQTDEIKALFGDVDEYDDYMARKLAIVQNKSLTPAQREAELDKLKDALTPENRAHVEQPVMHLTLAAKEEQARQNGASAAEIQQIRTQMVGADAARRLEALDREEAAWKERIRQYQQARTADPQQAQQLKATLFTPQEQLRLAAYE